MTHPRRSRPTQTHRAQRATTSRAARVAFLHFRAAVTPRQPHRRQSKRVGTWEGERHDQARFLYVFWKERKKLLLQRQTQAEAWVWVSSDQLLLQLVSSKKRGNGEVLRPPQVDAVHTNVRIGPDAPFPRNKISRGSLGLFDPALVSVRTRSRRVSQR